MVIIEKSKVFKCEFEGKKIIFEVDKLGIKGNKSVTCHYGDTTVLTVLTVKPNVKDSFSFFPLTVLFEERFYSVGRIPSSKGKREAKPSNFAITAARMIDRSLRSFFPTNTDKIEHEVLITNLVLSVEKECNPLLAAMWSSSLVCFLSSELHYFNDCFASLIIGKKEEKLFFNLSFEELINSSLELIVSATKEKIMMIEAGAAEIDEEELENIINLSHSKIKVLIDFFWSIFLSLGVKKREKDGEENCKVVIWKEEEILSLIKEIINNSDSWWEREKKMQLCQQDLVEKFCQDNSILTEKKRVEVVLGQLWDRLLKKEAEEKIRTGIRLDGRGESEIRPLSIEVNYLPNTVVHGSAIFQRGNTQVLSVVTLGKNSERQMTDNLLLPPNYSKQLIHHYNFPGFSVNSTTSHSSTRRIIGHGELVEKTLSYLFPSQEIFPFTVRVVSEVLSSDGSSSQASICASSLALITAGISLLRPAAGVALGMLGGRFLTDINAIEDRISEMDLKVAGTEKGICSIQLDVKGKGLDLSLLKESFIQAKQARLQILKEMKKHLSSFNSNTDLSKKTLKWRKFFVGSEKMGIVIGSGGKTINELTKRTGVSIDILSDGHIIVYHYLEAQLEVVHSDITRLIENTNNKRKR